jgi:V8-like Glu-specific endopeptidase
MKRTMWRSSIVLAVGALAVAGLTSPAQAKPATVHYVTGTAAQVAAYWTPEAMREAVPLDSLLPSVDARKLSHDVARGVPQVVAPAAGIQSFPNGGGAWTGTGQVNSTAGRVFFTFQGQNASCSGKAVTSGNKSTVLTAGHCVKLEGAFHTNWAFVPAYNNGNAPFGTWTARLTMATPQWVASEDINFDVGAAVVNQLNGQSLTDVVGAQGVAFNQARAQNMYAFGWPAAAPYDGTRMIYCSGRTFNALISTGIGMTCNMTGGASGGPWFQQFSEATGAGVQNSVNSYKINFISFWMFGPFFGADAQNLYNTAQAS